MLQSLLGRQADRGDPGATPRLDPLSWWQRQGDAVRIQLAAVWGVLLLLVAGAWAVQEYAHQRDEFRLAETGRFIAEFERGPVAEAWGRLDAAWQAEASRRDALLARTVSLRGPAQLAARRDHQQFVLETVAEYRLQDEIDTVYRFIQRLAICVQTGTCDRNVVEARLTPALTRFREDHQHYFAFEFSGFDLERRLRAITPIPAAGPDGAAYDQE